MGSRAASMSSGLRPSGFPRKKSYIAPGSATGIEGRVGHRPRDLSAEHVVPAAADLGPLADPGPQRGIEVAGERVERLVVVVVGVEHRVPELLHVVHRLAPLSGWVRVVPCSGSADDRQSCPHGSPPASRREAVA